MPDKKITELPTSTVADGDDIMTFVDVSEVDPSLKNRKITKDNYLDGRLKIKKLPISADYTVPIDIFDDGTDIVFYNISDVGAPIIVTVDSAFNDYNRLKGFEIRITADARDYEVRFTNWTSITGSFTGNFTATPEHPTILILGGYIAVPRIFNYNTQSYDAIRDNTADIEEVLNGTVTADYDLDRDVAFAIFYGQSNMEGTGGTYTVNGLANVYSMNAGNTNFNLYNKSSAGDVNVFRNWKQGKTSCDSFAELWQARKNAGELIPDLYIINVSRGGNGISYSETADASNNRFYPARHKSGFPASETANVWLEPVINTINDSYSAFTTLENSINEGLRQLDEQGKRVRCLGVISAIGEQDSKDEITSKGYVDAANTIVRMIEGVLGTTVNHYFIKMESTASQFVFAALMRENFDILEAQSSRYHILKSTDSGISPIYKDGVHYNASVQDWFAGQVYAQTVEAGNNGAVVSWIKSFTPDLPTNIVTEAPEDGITYARKDAGWVSADAKYDPLRLIWRAANSPLTVGTQDAGLQSMEKSANDGYIQVLDDPDQGRVFSMNRVNTSLWTAWNTTALPADLSNGDMILEIQSKQGTFGYTFSVMGRLDPTRAQTSSKFNNSGYAIIVKDKNNTIEFWDIYQDSPTVSARFKVVNQSAFFNTNPFNTRGFWKFSFQGNIISVSHSYDNLNYVLLAESDVSVDAVGYPNGIYTTGDMGFLIGIGIGGVTTETSNLYIKNISLTPGRPSEYNRMGFGTTPDAIVQAKIGDPVLIGSADLDGTGSELQVTGNISKNGDPVPALYTHTLLAFISPSIPLVGTEYILNFKDPTGDGVYVDGSSTPTTAEPVVLNPYLELVNGTALKAIRDIPTGFSLLLNLRIEKTGGTASEISIFTQISTNGTTWTNKPNTLRSTTISNDGDRTEAINLTELTPVTAGEYFRVCLTNSGGGTLAINTPPTIISSMGAIDGYSAKLAIQLDV